MAWEQIIGQGRVKDLLQRTLEHGRISHAYLFFGRPGIGKKALALEFAKALQCTLRGTEACGSCMNCRKAQTLTHPDIRVIAALPAGRNEQSGDDPHEKLSSDDMDAVREQLALLANDPYQTVAIPRATFIKLNSIREIRREASRSPVEGRYKVFVIIEADTMNAEAANAVLKTLEEPLPNALLILTTSHRERLLPTILSRCQQVECASLSPDELAAALHERDGVAMDEAAAAAAVAGGNLPEARAYFDADVHSQRESAVRFVRHALGTSHVAIAEDVAAILEGGDKQFVERWLSLLETWLRDALIVQQSAPLILGGDAEVRQRFVERFPRANLGEAIDRVEEAIADTRRNVYLPLVLTSLAYHLRSSIDSPHRA